MKIFLIMMVLAVMCLGGMVQADVFNMGPGLKSLEMVFVGNIGNEVGPKAGDFMGSTVCFGSVSYNYLIGKYEVTAAQYTDFLNHKAKTDTFGLYNVYMSTDPYHYGCIINRTGVSGYYRYSVSSEFANKPACYTTFWDALRFANWLNNGQGNADTEYGAYTLEGYNDIDGRWISRNTEAKWAITSEDEWVKAAYYDPNRYGIDEAGYWLFPTMTDYINTSMANFGGWLGHYTDVGFYPYPSAYGTFDQGGNVWERVESIAYIDGDNAYRCIRGGDEGYNSGMGVSQRHWFWNNIGGPVFRVVKVNLTGHSINAVVHLGDYSAPVEGVPVTIDLLTEDGLTTLRTYKTTLDAESRFHLKNVEPGTYKVSIKPSHWLRRVTGPVTVGAEDIELVIY